MVVFLVLLGIALVEMATDIYVPALPSINLYFATSKELVQFTLSINLIGIAISSLLYGVLSDCYGRRKIFLVGITIFAIASVLCYCSVDIYQLIFMRFIQGFGGGVAAVVGQAALKDLYSGTKHAQIISRVGMVTSLSPAIGPILGGFIVSYFDWQVVFLIIFIIACILLIMILFFFKETLEITKRENFYISKIFTSYDVILMNKTFLVMCSIQGFMLMWLWNEIANLPFLFIHIMNIKVEHYGYLISVCVFSYIIGTMINHRYLPKVGIENMIKIGIIMCIIPDCVLLLIQPFMVMNPYVIIFFWIPSTIGLAFVISNSISKALSAVPKQSVARASACLSFTQMSFGSLGIYINNLLFTVDGIIPISLTNIFYSCVSLFIYSFLYKKQEKIQMT